MVFFLFGEGLPYGWDWEGWCWGYESFSFIKSSFYPLLLTWLLFLNLVSCCLYSTLTVKGLCSPLSLLLLDSMESAIFLYYFSSESLGFYFEITSDYSSSIREPFILSVFSSRKWSSSKISCCLMKRWEFLVIFDTSKPSKIFYWFLVRLWLFFPDVES